MSKTLKGTIYGAILGSAFAFSVFILENGSGLSRFWDLATSVLAYLFTLPLGLIIFIDPLFNIVRDWPIFNEQFLLLKVLLVVNGIVTGALIGHLLEKKSKGGLVALGVFLLISGLYAIYAMVSPTGLI